MPAFIENPVIDIDKVAKILGKSLRREIENRGLLMWDVQKRTKFSQSAFSWYLSVRPTNNLDIYRQIAHAIWLSDRQFDDIVAQAKREVFGGGEVSFDHALSSKYGDTPEAMQELKSFAQFIDQKYGIKK